MKASIASIIIRGLGKYSQSRAHDAPWLDGESHEAYDKRTWKEHLHVRNGVVIIPETALMQCLHSAAKYSGEKKSGNTTWTKYLEGGVAIVDPAVTDVKADAVTYEDIYSNADGVRGSGKRVYRRFPVMAPWSAKFQALILDPAVTKEIFSQMLEIGGKYRGIGRWRPEKGGQNGRFVIDDLVWQDNRELKDWSRK